MNEKKDILLTFLLLKSANINNNKIDVIKKIVCLFIEKFSSIEKDKINPVNPSESINKKLILSFEFHQLIR